MRDRVRYGAHFRPNSDVARLPGRAISRHSALFDHLVGDSEQSRRECKAQRFCGFKIDDKFDLGRLLDGQIGRFFAFEDAAGVLGDGAGQDRSGR